MYYPSKPPDRYRVPALAAWPTFNYDVLKKYYRLLKHKSSLLTQIYIGKAIILI